MADGHKTLLQQMRHLMVADKEVADVLTGLHECCRQECTSQNSTSGSIDTESDAESTPRPMMTKAKTERHALSSPPDARTNALAVGNALSIGIFVKTADDGAGDLAVAKVPEPPRRKKVSFFSSLDEAEGLASPSRPSKVFAKTPAWPQRHRLVEDLSDSDNDIDLFDLSDNDDDQRQPMRKSLTEPTRRLNQPLPTARLLTKPRLKQTLEQFLTNHDRDCDIWCRVFLMTRNGEKQAMDINLLRTVEEALCFAGLGGSSLRFRGRILHPRLPLKHCGVELGSVLQVEDRSNPGSAFRRRAYCSQESRGRRHPPFARCQHYRKTEATN